MRGELFFFQIFWRALAMGKSKAKAHVVAEGHQPGVYTDYKDVQKQISGFKGKVNWGCDSLQEAEEQFRALGAWRCLSPENRAEKLTLEKAKEIVAEMLADSESYIKLLTQDNQQTEFSEVHEAAHIILTCELGTGGIASTITHSDGTVHVVQTTPGAKAPLKRQELGYEALKVAGGGY
ncbi:RNase H1/viroplasmin domain-containing protein [Photobacterium sp. OFAV2-7]|uniref:RNase H1/viroplasmin domain-containing protein n=1 Tax=Photobacterium sp. OFAV2-7 TaxID=2917748 RepID=UPI001EF4BEB6|nr:RNase H1/viroplasmin domain-containing protein [Photobacterium sp. OFAV2-7]MCG7584946.1 RNase H1/viroplasmin domain-containing protein [Photobacterium sp. OFAV2-7]